MNLINIHDKLIISRKNYFQNPKYYFKDKKLFTERLYQDITNYFQNKKNISIKNIFRYKNYFYF